MVSGVPRYYLLTHGQVSCWPGQDVMVRYGTKINAKFREMYMYINSRPTCSYHYKIQHLSLIRLAKLLLFFFPFFSLLSSIFLARISLIRSKNTYHHIKPKKRIRFLFVVSTHVHRVKYTLSTLARVLAEVST